MIFFFFSLFFFFEAIFDGWKLREIIKAQNIYPLIKINLSKQIEGNFFLNLTKCSKVTQTLFHNHALEQDT